MDKLHEQIGIIWGTTTLNLEELWFKIIVVVEAAFYILEGIEISKVFCESQPHEMESHFSLMRVIIFG